jgi:hypothetical protein
VSNLTPQPFTAQVVLRSSDPTEASRVVDEFRRAGFDVGELVANNFAISGARNLFERYFRIGAGRSRGAAAAPQLQGGSLQVERLPEHIRPLVRAIVTSRIDFGPTDW